MTWNIGKAQPSSRSFQTAADPVAQAKENFRMRSAVLEGRTLLPSSQRRRPWNRDGGQSDGGGVRGLPPSGQSLDHSFLPDLSVVSLRADLTPRGHLATSGDIFGGYVACGGWGTAPGI